MLLTWLGADKLKKNEDSPASSSKRMSDETDDEATKKKRTYQTAWEKEFTWLLFDEEKSVMTCKECKALDMKSLSNARSKNAFVTGTTNFQKSALYRHDKSDDHKLALAADKRQGEMTAAMFSAVQKNSQTLYAQIGAALILAQDDLPDTKFSSLLRAQALVQDKGSGGVLYSGHSVPGEMQESLAAICRQMAFDRIRASPYVGLMLDESLDIAVQKKLVILCRTVEDGKGVVELGENVEVKDGKAETIMQAVLSFLDRVEVPLAKVSGLGTDGANVMVGCKTGLVVRLQEQSPQIVGTWCVAHRLALVCHWAAKAVPYLEMVQTTLVNIYLFFHYSACRYNKIKELTDMMDIHVKRFKKPTNVRWLSLYESVQAVYSAWGCLCLALENEAASQNGDGANKAKGILKTVKEFKFIAVICMLCDVLSVLTRCSKVFQKDEIDIQQVLDMLSATVQTLDDLVCTDGATLQAFLTEVTQTGSFQGTHNLAGDAAQVTPITAAFVRNIKEEVRKRFPDTDMQTLKDLATVLDPRQLPQTADDVRQHGTEALDRLLARYTAVNAQEARHSFRHFKSVLANHRDKSLQTMCKHIITQCKDIFPEFCTLAEISVTIPLTSVPCERAFSSQNAIHTPLRSCTSVQSVDNKMMIKHASKREDYNENDLIVKACQHFTAAKQRRK